ncbi:hypothetical protein PNEG_02698 [Pneumocystis murina B123]|uniref:Disintegrin and metalloproteinase domain-containing protein B n=1 Tax=Pneumocystis murina (strain B123) TaxID=1069680 RepID=M7NP83_PNEMU|nr:hypothetical protein PNEG_02698 [Pneumocystis murina B123]EMR08916.1 hypothetical protein PNEG_02698 [Pneumocystis murina B123]
MRYLFSYILLYPFLKGIHASLITQQVNIHEVFPLKDVVLYPHETSKKSIDSHSSFDLTFTLPYHYQQTEYPDWMKKYVKLTMVPNLDLLSEDSYLKIHNEDGEVISSERIDRNNYRVYRGDAFITYTENNTGLLEKKWHKIGWARISLHQDGDLPIFEGAFSLSNDFYTVKTAENYMLLKEAHEPEIFEPKKSMVLWRESNKPPKTLRKRSNIYLDNKCLLNSLYDDMVPINLAALSSNSRKSNAAEKSSLFSSRIRLAEYIGDNSGCPKYKQIAYVGAALDCNYISMFQSSIDATNHVIHLYNRVSLIYEETFNISLGLLNITIMNRSCPKENPKVLWNVACSLQHNISTRLKHFSLWRTQIKDNIALWSLFTTCRNTMEVGIAWYGVLCQDIISKNQDINWVSGTNVIASPKNIEHVVLAHEIGHGFGASHDCTSETCKNESASCCPLSTTICNANEMYIMNPKSSITARTFSQCTIGQVCNNLKKKHVNSNCLVNNKNVSLISQKKCGNGIVEDGEDCDCGGEEGCKGNLCCNPKTCKFTRGSECDDSNEVCCIKCRYAPKNTICRSSRGECDLVEVCSGTSSICPRDKFKKDGTPCGNKSKCASGICTTRDMQCINHFNNSKGSCHSSCVLFCELGGVCIYSGFQSYFIDGTPCGFYGYCYKGNCIEGSYGKHLKSLLSGLKNWIFIIIFILGLVLAFLINCIFSRCFSHVSQKEKVIDQDYQTDHIPIYTNYPYNYDNIPNYIPHMQYNPHRHYHNFNERNFYYEANPNLPTN